MGRDKINPKSRGGSFFHEKSSLIAQFQRDKNPFFTNRVCGFLRFFFLLKNIILDPVGKSFSIGQSLALRFPWTSEVKDPPTDIHILFTVSTKKDLNFPRHLSRICRLRSVCSFLHQIWIYGLSELSASGKGGGYGFTGLGFVERAASRAGGTSGPVRRCCDRSRPRRRCQRFLHGGRRPDGNAFDTPRALLPSHIILFFLLPLSLG